VELFIDSGGDGLYTSGEQSGGFAEIQKEFPTGSTSVTKIFVQEKSFFEILVQILKTRRQNFKGCVLALVYRTQEYVIFEIQRMGFSPRPRS
jgi:hypothetical protein